MLHNCIRMHDAKKHKNGDNQLHVSAIYSHLQTEYRFVLGEIIQ